MDQKMTKEQLVEMLHNIKPEDLHYGGKPDVTEEDETCECCEECIDKEMLIPVPVSRYEELFAKATALDILSAALKRKGEVSEDIVWAVTGAEVDIQVRNLKQKADDYWGYYSEEKKKTEALEAKVKDLQKYIDSLMPEEEEEGGNG